MINRMKNAAALLGGSCAIYVVVAACGSSDSMPDALTSGTDASSGGSSGSAMLADGDDGAPVRAGASSIDGASVGGNSAADGGGIFQNLRDAMVDTGRALDAMLDGGGVKDALTDPIQNALASGYENGSRLRIRVLAGDDGSKQFVGWHDSALGVPCAFAKATDDSIRCLPTGQAMAYPGVFDDDQCTHPLVAIKTGACGSSPPMTTWVTTDGCAGFRMHVADVGPLSPAASSAIIYRVNNGICEIGGTNACTLAQECEWHRIGSERAASEFVLGTELVE